MKKYIGITIGPIMQAIAEASTPAALWFASNMFSDITRRLCEAIIAEESFKDVEIYSPYYSEEIETNDGIGKFHDRITFSTENYNDKTMRDIIIRVKKETTEVFSKEVLSGDNSKTFFEQYLQIHYAVIDEVDIHEGNCISALSDYLNVLELMKTFPVDNSENVIKKLFLGETDSGNRYIKDSSLFERVKYEKNQLKKTKDSIWTIEEIAAVHGNAQSEYKKYNYFAVVQADGDSLGVFQATLANENVTEMDKACLNFSQKASELIGEYGGMTIYAGGDDLLFFGTG